MLLVRCALRRSVLANKGDLVEWSDLRRAWCARWCGALAAASAVATVSFLWGCSAVNPAQPPGDLTGQVNLEPVPEFTGQVPVFAGPWAEDFTEAFVGAQSDVQRSVLRDGVITELEVAEVRQQFEQCMLERGFQVEWGEFGSRAVSALGGKPIRGDDSSDLEANTACRRSVEGEILTLYESISRNPDHLDPKELLVACAIELGVVDVGYTVAEYERDVAAEVPPWNQSSAAIRTCSYDPLSVLAATG